MFSIIGALKIKLGSEIIVPIMTDVGGVTPIFWGCKPVICDVTKNSFNIGLEEIKNRLLLKQKQ